MNEKLTHSELCRLIINDRLERMKDKVSSVFELQVLKMF